jgi:hypothetical protein
MSKIKICDRCKKEVDYGFKIKTSSKYMNVTDKTYHLCDDCFEEFYISFNKFLRGDNNAK